MSTPRFSLYLITDGAGDGARAALERALGGVPPGSVGVQLRPRGLDGRDLLERARWHRAITLRHGAQLLVNDRVDVALAVDADGVHLPSHGLSVAAARRLGPSLVIGVSTHSLEEARAATDGGADFVVFGPVWETPSKAGMGSPVGVASLAEAARDLPLGRVFALGGVTVERAAECARAGARVACIRAVLDAPDPAAAARALVDAGQLAVEARSG